MTESPLRVLHFSDVHVQRPVRELRWRDLFNKRLVGGANLALHRASRFAEAPDKLRKLDALRRRLGVDLVVCTGDYTALGTEAEHALARRCVEPFFDAPLGYVTVPGNHDHYLDDCISERRFERHFGDLLGSDWPEYATEEGWPLVRLAGENVAAVAVNSARPNASPLNSSGQVPTPQLDALRRVLQDERLVHRWVLLLTHYAPLREDGTPDSAHHGLANAHELLRVARQHPRLLLLHGHVHWRYAHPATAVRPWLFGAGSATYRGREGFWIYEFAEGESRAIPGGYNGSEYVVDATGSVTLTP